MAFVSFCRLIVVGLMENGREFGVMSLYLPAKEVLLAYLIYLIIVARSLICYMIAYLGVPRMARLAYIPMAELLVSYIIYTKLQHPVTRAWMYIVSLLYNLKTYSFSMKYTQSSRCSPLQYIRFLFYPILVYSDSYPTKARFDIKAFLRAILKAAVFISLLAVLCDLCFIPTIVKILKAPSPAVLVENFMNLSMAAPFVFYMVFRALFEGFLGALAEITLFDGEIHREWWGASTASEFWKNWNIPVHLFVREHIYTPLVNKGVSKHAAAFFCFLFSGLIHEYVTSMTLKKLNVWFLMGMILQVPLHYSTMTMKRVAPLYASVFFWLWFSAVGQPLIMIFIYRDHYGNLQRSNSL